MKLSARNQLPGTIRTTKVGNIMAEVVVDVEAGAIVAAITRSSVEALGLKEGERVRVVVKATEVMIARDD